jgi:hypothetical protein
MQNLHNVDNGWTIVGHCINESLTHAQSQQGRGVWEIVDNVDNEFTTTKIKENNVRYM